MSSTLINLHLFEIIPILLYLSGLLYLGLRKRNADSQKEDFILAGRTLTLPAFIATLVTTWYGGILGVGEFTWLYGISNWFVFGLPYYVFAILFAFFLSTRIREAGGLSIPDQFYRVYDNRSGKLSGIFTFFITLPAPYCLMLGLFIQMLTGWSLWVSISIGTAVSMLYVLSGGFRAVVRTDMLQFVLMFGGFAILLISLVIEFGGISYLPANLPELHLTWHGGNSTETIIVWFFIALWTFVDPGFHQRCHAAESPQTAKRGILISIVFWLVFDCMTTLCGLYARALMSDINPVLAFPLLGHNFLPPVLSGLFLTGLLATIMSTVDSFSLLCALTLGHDLQSPEERKSMSLSRLRIGLLITAIISILLAISIPSVIQIWYIVGTLFVPPLLLPLLAVYFPGLRLPTGWTLPTMLLAFFSSLGAMLYAVINSPSIAELTYYADIPPMFIGLFASIVLFFAGGIANRNEKFK